ncbi:hypothetical protein PMIN03_012931 [Paraphaeosphaeria minitans]
MAPHDMTSSVACHYKGLASTHTRSIHLILSCFHTITMSKMNPQLKTLLAAIDNPVRVLSLDLKDKIFKKYAREASDRCLGLSSWLSVMTATAITLKSSALMIALYNHATAATDLAESVVIAEFMRDVGIGGIAVIGIPRVVNMLTAFQDSLPSAVRSSLKSTSSYRAEVSNIVSIQRNGQMLWKSVHSPMEEAMDRKLARAHPDLPNYLKDHIYGGLLMRPQSRAGGTAGRITTSLSAIAYLRADQGSSPQLLGHVFGLQRAWGDGSWKLEPSVGSAEGIQWLTSDEGCVWVLEMIDDLMSAVSHDPIDHPKIVMGKL